MGHMLSPQDASRMQSVTDLFCIKETVDFGGSVPDSLGYEWDQIQASYF